MSQKNKRLKALSVIVLNLGLLLMTYTITVEDELGAVPLLLIGLGTVGLLIIYFKRKRVFEKQEFNLKTI